MLVAIVTVFNEYFNFGSFLQAFALQEYLAQHQVNVEFIEEKSITKTKKKLRRLLTKSIARLAFNLKNAFVYSRVNQLLKAEHQFSQKRYDAVILGSDEIWNLNNKTFEHSPVFFGEGMLTNRIVSYAPSANGMTETDFLNYPEKVKAIQKIHSLSARDERSVKLLKEFTQKSVVEVLDPTFLIDWTPYEKQHGNDNYILVYCYLLDDARVREIQLLARYWQCEIIVVGHYSDKVPEVKIIDPFMFLSYVRDARAVITDSFHGTIFSIQYNRPFCSFVGENYKVANVLETFGLTDRNYAMHQSILDLFACQIDYDLVNQQIANKKKESITFLVGALGLKS